MRILAEPRRRALVRVLTLMREGERIAADCAARQVALTDKPDERRFLRAQARQEQFHAAVFDLGVRTLPPRVTGARSGSLSELSYRLDRDLASGNLAATIFGFQIVLEGLGQAVLAQLDVAMSAYGYGMDRLRRVLLRQEDAHHAFGLSYFEAETAAGRGVATAGVVGEYLDLARRQIEECQNLCDELDAEPAGLVRRFEAGLPAWVREVAA